MTEEERKRKERLMQANSKAWHSASDADKKILESANQKLRNELGAGFDKKTGTSFYRDGSEIVKEGVGKSFVGVSTPTMEKSPTKPAITLPTRKSTISAPSQVAVDGYGSKAVESTRTPTGLPIGGYGTKVTDPTYNSVMPSVKVPVGLPMVQKGSDQAKSSSAMGLPIGAYRADAPKVSMFLDKPIQTGQTPEQVRQSAYAGLVPTAEQMANAPKIPTSERLKNMLIGGVQDWASGMVNAVGTAEEGRLLQHQQLQEQMTADIQRALDAKGVEGEYTDPMQEHFAAMQKGVSNIQGTADDLSAKAQVHNEQAKRGLSGASALAMDVGTAGVGLALDTVTGLVTGGGGMLPMFARTYGGTAQTARQAGADHRTQVNAGLASGALSVATERISSVGNGVLKKVYGAGLSDDASKVIIAKVLDKLNKTGEGRATLQAISEWGVGALGEGLEEVLENVGNVEIAKMTYDQHAQVDPAGLLYDALVGTVFGGVTGGIGNVGSATGKAVVGTVNKAQGKISDLKNMDFEETNDRLLNKAVEKHGDKIDKVAYLGEQFAREQDADGNASTFELLKRTAKWAKDNPYDSTTRDLSYLHSTEIMDDGLTRDDFDRYFAEKKAQEELSTDEVTSDVGMPPSVEVELARAESTPAPLESEPARAEVAQTPIQMRVPLPTAPLGKGKTISLPFFNRTAPAVDASVAPTVDAPAIPVEVAPTEVVPTEVAPTVNAPKAQTPDPKNQPFPEVRGYDNDMDTRIQASRAEVDMLSDFLENSPQGVIFQRFGGQHEMHDALWRASNALDTMRTMGNADETAIAHAEKVMADINAMSGWTSRNRTMDMKSVEALMEDATALFEYNSEVQNKRDWEARNANVAPEVKPFLERVDALTGKPPTPAEHRQFWDVRRRFEEFDRKISNHDRDLVRAVFATGDEAILLQADSPRTAQNFYIAQGDLRAARDVVFKESRQYRLAREEKTFNAVRDLTLLNVRDKANGIRYDINTIERNVNAVFGLYRNGGADKHATAAARRFTQNYIEPIHKAVANMNRLTSTMREIVADLRLTTEESGMTQLILENRQDMLADYCDKNPDAVQHVKKCEDAAVVFKNLYDSLHGMWNEARVRNGDEPIEPLADYAPHFLKEAEAETKVGKVLQKMGLYTNKEELPTEISGITEEFKPRKAWNRHALHRTGDSTIYDAVHGFDKYIDVTANNIFLTDSVCDLRELEFEIRYRGADETTRKRVELIEHDSQYDALSKLALREKQLDTFYNADNVKANAKEATHGIAVDAMTGNVETDTDGPLYLEDEDISLQSFVCYLRDYTDLLANKKSSGDRKAERRWGRAVYDVATKSFNRIAGNMVGINPATWATNFAPIFQSLGQTDPRYTLYAIWDTARNGIKSDEVGEKSDFLVNRKGTDKLIKSPSARMADTLSAPMGAIDMFTANVIVRARMQQNMHKKKMGFEEALHEADNFAASIMADRSKGAMPLLFEQKDPTTKLFTLFQVEVKNTFDYYFKDLPLWANGNKAKIINGLVSSFVGSYLFNTLTEELLGRRVIPDPIYLVQSFVTSAFGLDDEEKEPWLTNVGQAGTGLAENVAQELPFIGGLLGGGRVPTATAMPDVGDVWKTGTSDASGAEKANVLMEKGVKPLSYIGLPFGASAVWKTADNVAMAKNGGSIGYLNGERVLEYQEPNTLPQWIQSAMFGKNATPNAQAYYDRNFIPFFGAGQTAVYEKLRKDVGSNQMAVDIIHDTERAEGEHATTVGRNGNDVPFIQGDEMFKGRNAIMLDDRLTVPNKERFDNYMYPNQPSPDFWKEDTFLRDNRFDDDMKKGYREISSSGVDTTDYLIYDEHYKQNNAVRGAVEARTSTFDLIVSGDHKPEAREALVKHFIFDNLSEGQQKAYTEDGYADKLDYTDYCDLLFTEAEFAGTHEKGADDSAAFLQALEDKPELWQLAYENLAKGATPYRWDMLKGKDETAGTPAMQSAGLKFADYYNMKLYCNELKGKKKDPTIAHMREIGWNEKQVKACVEAMGWKY